MPLPTVFETSWLCRPGLWLARWSADDLSALLSQSRVFLGLQSALHVAGQVGRSIATKVPVLPQLARFTHLLSLLALLAGLCVMDTGPIGVLVVFAAVATLFRVWLSPPQRLAFSVFDGLVLAFYLSMLLSAAFSSYVHTSLHGLGKLTLLVGSYGVFRLSLASLSQRAQSALFLWLVALGVCEAAIGLYQWVNHIQPLATWQDTSVNPEDQLTRIFGTLKPANPNLLAGFLIPSFALSVGTWVKSVLTHDRWGRLLWVLPSGLLLVALVLTGSRGSYLAIAAIALTVFIVVGVLLWTDPAFKAAHRLKTAWLLSAIGGVSLVGLVALLYSPIRTRILSIFAFREDSSNAFRMNVWQSTWQIIQDNWLLGIGPGNDTFKQVYGLYMVSGFSALSAYSIFLEIWAEQGIVGLLIFLALAAAIKCRMLLALYAQRPLPEKLKLFSFYLVFIGSVVYGLFDTIWYRPSVNLLFWLALAAFATHSETVLQAREARS
jgi:putative inorganic carbon (hco3(-)) transporter